MAIRVRYAGRPSGRRILWAGHELPIAGPRRLAYLTNWENARRAEAFCDLDSCRDGVFRGFYRQAYFGVSIAFARRARVVIVPNVYGLRAGPPNGRAIHSDSIQGRPFDRAICRLGTHSEFGIPNERRIYRIGRIPIGGVGYRPARRLNLYGVA